MLDVQPGTRMLDLCAAPGGKSVVALQTLNVGKFKGAQVQVFFCTEGKDATFLIRLRSPNLLASPPLNEKLSQLRLH